MHQNNDELGPLPPEEGPGPTPASVTDADPVDYFVSASDLSSALDSSQISTSSSNSSSSSSVQATSTTTTSSSSLSNSNCLYSPDVESLSTNFANFSSASSTPSTIHRCESWAALQNQQQQSQTEEENQADGSSDKENQNVVEKANFDNNTFHTPSTSLQCISNKKVEQKVEENDLLVEINTNSEQMEILTTTLTPYAEGDLTPSPCASASVSSESNNSKDGISQISAKDLKDLAKAAKLAAKRKPAKKKMWYQQIFSASYKSRSGDFKKLFKELPIKERLLVDYSCALQKEILVQGRMYVSQGYMSFHANIFGWETQTSIRLRDITSITKEKTALVIPNAIQVVTEPGDKLFFTSFVTRDATYLMLFKLWQNSLLEDALPSKEIQRLIHTSYGEELVITSEDEGDDGDGLISSDALVAVGDELGLAKIHNIHTIGGGLVQGSSLLIDSKQVCSSGGDTTPSIIVTGGHPLDVVNKSKSLERNGVGLGLVPLVNVEPSDLSDSSDSDADFVAAEGEGDEELEVTEIPTCPIPHSEGREMMNAVIPCNIDQLFTMLFTSSKFFLDFHTVRKTFNINQSQWEVGKDGKKTRQISMTVSLNAAMGPKHSEVTETQRMDTVSKPGLFYAIDSESINAGIPYADTFYLTIHYCLSRLSANESKLIVVNQLKYRKSTWGLIKSIIEKNVWAGVEEFYSHLEKALKEECTKMLMGSSPVSSPKHGIGNLNSSLPRRRPLRKKGPAPGIPMVLNSSAPMSSSETMAAFEPSELTSSSSSSPGAASSSQGTEGSTLGLKLIFGVLLLLLGLNGFLFFKLHSLEVGSSSGGFFPAPTFTFTGEIPQTHEDWLTLLQKQEALHRTELQKWHEILLSSLKILHQAESDLEALKFHIGSYSGGKYSGEMTAKLGEALKSSKIRDNLDLKPKTPSDEVKSEL